MSIDWHIQTFDQLESTQLQCFEAAREGASEGTVVSAKLQSAGKGRHGRVWETGEGNLAFSCVLKPSCELKDIGQLAIVVGVALAECFQTYTDAPVTLKWPNDVFIDGKKCAGILIESETSTEQTVVFAIAGVGINIVSAPEYAHTLNEFCERALITEDVLGDVLKSIGKYYELWEQGDFEKIRGTWNTLSLQEIDENGHLIEGDVRHAAGH